MTSKRKNQFYIKFIEKSGVYRVAFPLFGIVKSLVESILFGLEFPVDTGMSLHHKCWLLPNLLLSQFDNLLMTMNSRTPIKSLSLAPLTM